MTISSVISSAISSASSGAIDAEEGGAPSDPPVPTFGSVYRAPTHPNSTTYTFSSVDIGDDVATETVIGTISMRNPQTLSSVNVTISGETSPTVNIRQSANGAIFDFVKPGGTTAEIETVWSAELFTDPNLAIYTVTTADLSSGYVDGDSGTTSGTTLSINITSSDGGFIVAAAVQTGLTATSASVISGDETYTERGDAVAANGRHLHADASGTGAATDDNTITATFDASNTIRMVAASYR